MHKLAIVGRPNVGKSALFNRICDKRIAIVDEAEGITRDRLYAEADWFGRPFEVIDTGGIDPRSPDQFSDEIRRQAQIAILEADTLVMVVDSRVGITELDEELARELLKTGKPLTLAVNKIDHRAHEERVYPFYALGIAKVIGVSAIQGYQIAELLELAWDGFTPRDDQTLHHGIRLSLIGRANTGKSTLVNALLNEERCVVSPLAGTTRDSIDIPITVDDQDYTLIDTAGIRRKKAEYEVVEKYAAMRTERAIERSDVCLLVFDVQEGMTSQEKRIVQQIEKAGKSCIVLMNKWDLVEGFRMEHCLQALYQESPFLSHCPVLFISAKAKRNLNKIFPEVKRVYEASKTRISTHQLNTFVERAMQINHPPMLNGKRLRVYYMTQVDVQPPRFILFVNNPSLMSETYKRYLINQFRKKYTYAGTPLQLHLRGKSSS
ncbi:MAG: ribosome biogenesis GTPase Der [Chlamydiales bacterium]|nr:ribosome biogenesis GTPase Der [Chlamydiales bacterium]